LLKLLFSFLLILTIRIGVAQKVSPVITDTSSYKAKDSTAFAFDVLDDKDDESEFAGPADTTHIELRKFSSTDIERLKADPDLSYTQPPTVAESLWDRLKQWLAWLFSTLFEKATTTDLGRFIVYLIAIILVIGIIMMLLKVNAFKVFYSGADQAKQPYQVFHENIHEMDFDALIKDATEKKEYRLATRLVFLHALKILSDKHLIDFKPGKTNHDYVEELTTGDLKTGLNELSFYFDYAWYGNFAINETQFQKVNGNFTSWKEKV
jgi:hypothetical protein